MTRRAVTQGSRKGVPAPVPGKGVMTNSLSGRSCRVEAPETPPQSPDRPLFLPGSPKNRRRCTQRPAVDSVRLGWVSYPANLQTSLARKIGVVREPLDGRDHHGTHIQAKQPQAPQQARFPRPHVDEGGSQDPESAAKEGPEADHRQDRTEVGREWVRPIPVSPRHRAARGIDGPGAPVFGGAPRSAGSFGKLDGIGPANWTCS